MNDIKKQLIAVIKEDMKKATRMMKGHKENNNLEAWNFQRGVKAALNSTLADIKYLSLENK